MSTASQAFAQVGVGDKLQTPGARANAMGGAFVAVADDASATIINPAGVQFLTKPQVYFEFNSAEGETSGEVIGQRTNRPSFFALAIPLTDRVGVAFSHNEPFYLDASFPYFRGAPGDRQQLTLGAETWSGSIALNAGHGWRVGTTVSYETAACSLTPAVPPPGAVSDLPADECSFDGHPVVGLGGLWQATDSISIGVSGQIAPERALEDSRISTGVAFRVSPRFLTSVEVDAIGDTSAAVTELHVGGEYQIPMGGNSLYLRAGAFIGAAPGDSESVNSDRGGTVGGGIVIGRIFQVDAAFVSEHDRFVASAAVRF